VDPHLVDLRNNLKASWALFKACFEDRAQDYADLVNQINNIKKKVKAKKPEATIVAVGFCTEYWLLIFTPYPTRPKHFLGQITKCIMPTRNNSRRKQKEQAIARPAPSTKRLFQALHLKGSKPLTY
jgi:hypothetical protein